MALKVVIGPPCAGKSTHVVEHAADGDVVVDFDKLAQALGSAHPHEAPDSVKGAAFASRSAAIDHVISEGLDAWVIHTSPAKDAVARYRAAGAEFVVLDPGIDECLERAKERPEWTTEAIRHWYGSPPDLDPDNSKAAQGGHMHIKSTPFRVKAAGEKDGLEEGQFVGYASVFGNTDSYGDIVDRGAFSRTLDEWDERGGTIPVLWGHDMGDPFSNIGGVVTAEEDETGLKVTGQLDLDNPTAAQVYRLIKGGRTNTMSFAYSVRDSEKRPDGLHLKDLDLFEVSVVQVPANELAEVTAVKSATAALAKAGRTLSAKNETALRDARDAIDSVLSSLDGDDGKPAQPGGTNDQEKASGEPEAKPGASDETLTGKSSASREEPKAGPSARVLAELQLLTLTN